MPSVDYPTSTQNAGTTDWSKTDAGTYHDHLDGDDQNGARWVRFQGTGGPTLEEYLSLGYPALPAVPSSINLHARVISVNASTEAPFKLALYNNGVEALTQVSYTQIPNGGSYTEYNWLLRRGVELSTAAWDALGWTSANHIQQRLIGEDQDTDILQCAFVNRTNFSLHDAETEILYGMDLEAIAQVVQAVQYSGANGLHTGLRLGL